MRGGPSPICAPAISLGPVRLNLHALLDLSFKSLNTCTLTGRPTQLLLHWGTSKRLSSCEVKLVIFDSNKKSK